MEGRGEWVIGAAAVIALAAAFAQPWRRARPPSVVPTQETIRAEPVPPPPVSAGAAVPTTLAECPSAADAAPVRPRNRRPPRRPRPGWPVCGGPEECITATGEPGFRYREPPPALLGCPYVPGCFNPCPVGMAPDFRRTYGHVCERLCRRDEDCDLGACRDGLCDSMGDPPCGGPPGVDGCVMPDGRSGYRCEQCGPCYPWCKAGTDLSGGTHCVRECRSNADCPGGRCIDGGCTPVCPSEGCPYPWE